MIFWALSYSLPANPSRYRVAVWKALKEAGAIYLQPAVAVAPQREGMREAFLRIRRQVLENGGEAALLTMAYDDEKDEAALLTRFHEAREEEYQGIAADARRLKAQMDWEEKESGGLDAASLHRYGLESGRLHRRLAAAQAHDFFEAQGQEEAVSALEEAANRLPQTASGKRPVSPPKRPKVKKPVPIPASAPEPEEEESRELPVFLF